MITNLPATINALKERNSELDREAVKALESMNRDYEEMLSLVNKVYDILREHFGD